MELVVYLAGEIHSDWREEIKRLASEKQLPIVFKGPMENHGKSDAIGEDTSANNQTLYYGTKLPQALIISVRGFGFSVQTRSLLFSAKITDNGIQPWMPPLPLKQENR